MPRIRTAAAVRRALLASLPALGASIFVVPLNKQRVPVTENGRRVSHKTAYFGSVFIGLPEPQEFTVVFDTGSGHLFLPSAACRDEPCLQHRRYDRAMSASAVDINDDGTQAAGDGGDDRDRVSIAYGTGEIFGEFVREVVCIGARAAGGVGGAAGGSLPPRCAEARIILASQMTPEPFRSFQFDGVLGLGLDSLALDPEFHVFSRLAGGWPLGALDPIFSVFLARHDGVHSEIAFGGHDESRMRGPLRWVPVADPRLGFWRVQIHGVRVGNRSVPLCDDGGCNAILDTGTSILGVPRQSLQTFLGMTARSVAGGQAPEDCRDFPGPAVVFDLGAFSIQLGAEDYSRPAASQLKGSAAGEPRTVCRASLLPVELPALGPKEFLWGEPVLRRYYTAYDARERRVGFAPAVQPEAPPDASPPSLPPAAGGIPEGGGASGAGGAAIVI